MSRVLPILFNTDMVRAILKDRKKATRRCVKPRSKNACGFYVTFRKSDNAFMGVYDYDENEMQFDDSQMPPCQTGDILYVRETWSTQRSNACMGNTMAGCPYDSCETASGPCFEKEYIYKASDKLTSSVEKWHPSIHMPKEAARIWLKVTDVRVERLQDMTLDDFLNEGVVLRPEAFNDPENAYLQAREIFKGIWDGTISKAELPEYGWEANPWVWVIEFERCGRPEPCIMWCDGEEPEVENA